MHRVANRTPTIAVACESDGAPSPSGETLSAHVPARRHLMILLRQHGSNPHLGVPVGLCGGGIIARPKKFFFFFPTLAPGCLILVNEVSKSPHSLPIFLHVALLAGIHTVFCMKAS